MKPSTRRTWLRRLRDCPLLEGTDLGLVAWLRRWRDNAVLVLDIDLERDSCYFDPGGVLLQLNAELVLAWTSVRQRSEKYLRP